MIKFKAAFFFCPEHQPDSFRFLVLFPNSEDEANLKRLSLHRTSKEDLGQFGRTKNRHFCFKRMSKHKLFIVEYGSSPP